MSIGSITRKAKEDEEFQKIYGRSDRHAESCASVSAEFLQSGGKRCEGETRTAGEQRKMRAEKLMSRAGVESKYSS